MILMITKKFIKKKNNKNKQKIINKEKFQLKKIFNFKIFKIKEINSSRNKIYKIIMN